MDLLHPLLLAASIPSHPTPPPSLMPGPRKAVATTHVWTAFLLRGLVWASETLLLVLLILSGIAQAMKAFFNTLLVNHSNISRRHAARNTTDTFLIWQLTSVELDRLEGHQVWKEVPHSKSFDHRVLEHTTHQLRGIGSGDIRGLMHLLRSGLSRNMGGMCNTSLYRKTFYGTKQVIENYLQEVCDSLGHILNAPDVSSYDKLRFFTETRHSFGRTALVLSGGSSLGMCHLGVVKALKEQDLLPRIIAGASAGAIIASLVATHDDEELPNVFGSQYLDLSAFESLSRGSLPRKVRRLLTRGVLNDIEKLQVCVRDNLGDITFREAYDRTGRILNIFVAAKKRLEVSRLLNYLTAPDVLIWSAACASCAHPGLFAPIELMVKDSQGSIYPYLSSGLKWTTGGTESELPLARLSEMFNVNHFIVSQINPPVPTFLDEKVAHGIIPRLKIFLRSEIDHRLKQTSEMGLIPNFLIGWLPVGVNKQGDITISPASTFRDFALLFSNPTRHDLAECIRIGEHNTWPKICHIDASTRIERYLDGCVQTVRPCVPYYEKALLPSWCSYDETDRECSVEHRPH